MIDAATRSVLASPRRLAILQLIWREARPAGAIHRAMPDVTFGAVSQHLRALERRGLVECRSAGRERWYRARCEALGSIGASLEAMWDDALWRLTLIAELDGSRRGPRSRGARVRRRALSPGRRTDSSTRPH